MIIKNSTLKILLISLTLNLILNGCVSKKKYDELADELKRCKEGAAIQKRDYESRLEDFENEISKLRSESVRLRSDTARQSGELRRLRGETKKLKAEKDDLENRLDALMQKGKTEIGQILGELKERETQLKIAETDLEEKQKLLAKTMAEIAAKESRIQELEQILEEQKNVLRQLLNRIEEALKGYTGKGLRVHEKDGKVYVSLEEQLLFESGKTEVKPEGKKALSDLAKVLEKEKDISLLIEGHTDNVPLSGLGPIKDNWDLSVLRATSVTRIILQNPNISPIRITSAGRGEFLPVASNTTAEGRAQNRRTEIIISPKIQDIIQILKK